MSNPIGTPGPGYTNVMQVTGVPAGTYLATESVEFSTGVGISQCFVGGPTVTIAHDSDITALVSATAVGQSYSSAAQGVVTLSATGTIAIYCTGPTGSGVQRATITAVAVGTAH